MNTPTPRTDAATYPADCLGATLVTNRDCPRALERELTALATERDQLRDEVERLTKQAVFDGDHIHTLNAAFATRAEVTDANARAERAEAELATERARLDSGQIMLTVAGERVWHCGVDLRAAIDAAMKEDAK